MSAAIFPRLRIAGLILIIFILAIPALTQTQTKPNEPTVIDASSAVTANAAKQKDEPLSILDYEALLKSDPNDTVSENNLGALYFAAGRFDEAADIIRRAADASPDNWRIQLNASIAIEHVNDLADSIKYAQAAYEIAPKEVRVRQQLCDMYIAVNEPAAAVPCFDALVKDNSGDVEDLLGYGEALMLSGDPTHAESAIRDVIKMSPRLATAYNSLGMALFKQKKYKDAVDSFRQAISLMPDEPGFRYDLALADMAMRNTEGAISQYNLLKQSDPKLADKLYRMMFAGQVLTVGH